MADDAEEGELRARVRMLACGCHSANYHAPSRSYIFYVPWMVPFGAKGIGDFPDEAYESLCASVEKMTRGASKRDLLLWLEKYEETLHE